MDYRMIESQFTEVHVAGPGAERIAECVICWATVVDSSKRLHLEYHVKRNEFDLES